jgi:hypothetical protein
MSLGELLSCDSNEVIRHRTRRQFEQQNPVSEGIHPEPTGRNKCGYVGRMMSEGDG